MLRQYQLHRGIRRLQPRFGHSKQFGMTTTMAASAAPAPWNRLPPSVNNFRWWDTIFLNFSYPFTIDKTPSVRWQKKVAGPRNGKTHTPLVPALELPFSCLATTSDETSPGEETLKSIYFPLPQPPISTIFAAIEELGYLVEVHPYPNNDINPYPNGDWIMVVRIGDTSLSAPGLTRVEEDKALKRAILKISTGVTRSFAP
jgi:hypothetical protein